MNTAKNPLAFSDILAHALCASCAETLKSIKSLESLFKTSTEAIETLERNAGLLSYREAGETRTNWRREHGAEKAVAVAKQLHFQVSMTATEMDSRAVRLAKLAELTRLAEISLRKREEEEAAPLWKRIWRELVR